MINQALFAFIVPAVISLLVTPLVIRLAKYAGAIDQPNERKIHSTPIPRLGGVAIFISFFLSLALFSYFNPGGLNNCWKSDAQGITLAVSFLLVLALGVWDDFRSLKARQKFLAQVLVSTAIYASGIHVSIPAQSLGLSLLPLGIVDYLATVIWIVGVTNAINLIDGLDGLASGVVIIAALTIFPISVLGGDWGTTILSLLIAGSVFGFLRYNFNPAKIFLGDSGSLFLGFLLAVLSIQSSTKSTTAFALIVPVLALGLPIMDTVLSILRRLLHSWYEQKETSILRRFSSVFYPDRRHIHHQLISLGLSHRNAVMLLYVVSCCLGLGAFLIAVTDKAEASLVLLVVGIATFVGIQKLRYREMAVLRNGVLLPLFDSPIINHELFLVFIDVVFILISYWTAHLLTTWNFSIAATHRELFLTLMLVCGIQFIVFWAGGIYKGFFRHFGLADVLKTGKIVILAVIASSIVLTVVEGRILKDGLPTQILDFYFLASFVIGSRFSFAILKHLNLRDHNGSHRALIYGADPKGTFILDKMLDGEFPDVSPAAFLDDDPHLEGKSLRGYPIHVCLAHLTELIKDLKIKEIYLAREPAEPETLTLLKETALVHGLAIKRFGVYFEDVPFDKIRVQEPHPSLAFLHSQIRTRVH